MPLVLPSPKERLYGNEPFLLPFPHLRKGDMAFHLRMEGAAALGQVCQNWEEAVRRRKRSQVPSHAISSSLMVDEGSQVLLSMQFFSSRLELTDNFSAQVFVNLETVNYILHGIQHYGDSEPGWRDSFWRGFGLHRLDPLVQQNAELLCAHVVRWCMAPFGVVVSETVHAPHDQAVAMVVDGRIERMRNYWAEQLSEDEEVQVPQAGDELVLVLERIEVRLGLEDLEAELERWAHILPGFGAGSEAVKAVFPVTRGNLLGVGPVEKRHWVWQLVPGVKSMGDARFWADDKGFFSLGRVY